jgi:hypothetical protein
MSAFGTKRASEADLSMSAIGGKADMAISERDIRFRPKADIGQCEAVI